MVSDRKNRLSRASIVGLGALLVSMSAVPAVSASPEKPEAFVRRVYARYINDGPGIQMARPDGTPFYAAVLLDAFATDSAGNASSIDWDPLCNCQTWEKLRIKSVVMAAEQSDLVKARVSVVNLGSITMVTLTLSRTPAGWRIADVGEKGAASVLALLRDTNLPPSPDAQPSGTGLSPPKP